MLKSELLEKLENIKDDEQVDSILESYLTLDNFKTRLDSDKDFKSFMDSEKDKHSQKAINTALENFKNKDMQKLIEAEVLKRTGKGETDEQKQIRELTEKFEQLQKEKVRAEMVSKYKDVLTEKKIPSNMIDFLLADTDEITNANIELFESSMNNYVTARVQETMKGSSYVPPKGDSSKKITWEDVLKDSSLYDAYKNQKQ